MVTSRRRTADTMTQTAPIEVREPDAAPVLDDRDAALQLRSQARGLREQAGQLMRNARAAHAAAEQRVRDATRESQGLYAQAGGIEGEAMRLERRVVLADQADRLAVQVAEAERELVRVVDEHARLVAEVEDIDGRLAELRDKAEESAAGVVYSQASGDGAAVAEFRVRMRAVEEVRAEAVKRRATAAERLAAVGPGGQARTWAERHVAELRARRDKVLNELDPGFAARRGDVGRHVEQLAGADTEAQISAVVALLSAP